MISKGYELDAVVYTTPLYGLCKQYDDMISKEHEPDVVTYGTLMAWMCEKAETENTLNFWMNDFQRA
jgi:hypothetical protein